MNSTNKTTATIPSVIKPNTLDNLAKTFCNGVSSSSSFSSDVAILPISVFIPVDVTIPRPLPYATTVDINSIFTLSPKATSSVNTASSFFSTGTDSPVKLASVHFKFIASINLISAPTVSPSSTITKSPGTKSLALIL